MAQSQVADSGRLRWTKGLVAGIHTPLSDRTLEHITLGLVGFALILRIARFLRGDPLWLDETYLAVNIVNRPMSGLVTELDYDQIAPVGFLFAIRAMFVALGAGEYTLRIYSLVFSIVSLYLFYRLSKEVLAKTAVPIAIGLYAVSSPLIRYAAEMKPYGSDAAIALGIIYLLVRLRRDTGFSYWMYVALAVVGNAAVWLSFSSVFVLAGAGGAMICHFLYRRSWKHVICFLCVVATWLGSFAFQMSFLMVGPKPLLPETDFAFLSAYYSNDFLSWRVAPVWMADKLVELMRYGSLINLAAMYLFGFLIGLIYYFSSRLLTVAMLLLPLLVVWVVSGFEFYPATDRFMLFMIPSVLLIVASGFDELRSRLGARSVTVWLVFVGIAFALQFKDAARDSVGKGLHEDIRGVLAYLDSHYEEGDDIYLHWSCKPQYQFYVKPPLANREVIMGTRSEQPSHVAADLASLRGRDRIWFVFSTNVHTWPLGQFILGWLEGNGRLLDSYESDASAVYLFDLRGDETGDSDP